MCPDASRLGVYSRELDVLDSFLLLEDPTLPALVAVGHATEDNLGDLEARVPETNCQVYISEIESNK